MLMNRSLLKLLPSKHYLNVLSLEPYTILAGALNAARGGFVLSVGHIHQNSFLVASNLNFRN